MQNTELITHPESSDLGSEQHPGPESPSGGDMVREVLALTDVVPVAGPPAILLAGPLVLFALMLAGPFVLLLTLAALVVGAAALVALAGAILASPYLLVCHLRSRRAAARASASAPASQVVSVQSGRAAA